METDSFIIHIKSEDFLKDIADDVKNRYDTSNYDADRPLPKGMNKKVISLMKDELGGNIMTECVSLRPKTYCYLTKEDKNVKNTKGTKKCVIKRIIEFDDYKECKSEMLSKYKRLILIIILIRIKQNII